MFRAVVTGILIAASGNLLATQDASSVFLRPCSDGALAVTGEYRAFNEAQCRRAKYPIRTQSAQVGGTCVCETLLNAAHDLGVSGTIEDIRSKHNCDRAVFSAVFKDYADTDSELSGRVFGGAVGAIASHSLVATDEAIKQIVQSVSIGHVVAVGLDAKPIYDYWAQQQNVTYTGLGLTGRHALLVRALLRDANGRVTDYVVVDSSGPARVYSVPAPLFEKAYDSLRARFGRGVYISKAVRR